MSDTLGGFGAPPKTGPTIVTIGDDRIFADGRLQASINKAIDDARLIDDGKHVAAVAYADRDGFRCAVVARGPLDTKWTVAADKPWHGKLGVSAAVVWSR